MKDKINIKILTDLQDSLQELLNKSDKFPEVIKKINLIHQQLISINTEIEDTINSLDRKSFALSDLEKQRIESDEIVDRAIDRIKPFMLLSLLIENSQ